MEGGESANSISVSKVRETFDFERWASRDRDDVMRDANEPAFDLTEGGCGAWMWVNEWSRPEFKDAYRRERRVCGGGRTTPRSEVGLTGLVERQRRDRHRRCSGVEKRGQGWLAIGLLKLERGRHCSGVSGGWGRGRADILTETRGTVGTKGDGGRGESEGSSPEMVLGDGILDKGTTGPANMWFDRRVGVFAFPGTEGGKGERLCPDSDRRRWIVNKVFNIDFRYRR